jgi:peptide/nickel transport system permease protein
MTRYLVRRLALYFPTLILASLGIFGIMRVIPGDVAMVILGGETSTPAALAQADALRERLGLLDSLPVQYFRWVWSMVNGEFGGTSLVSREPISEILARRLPVTLELAAWTALIAWVVSIPAGVLAAVYQNRTPDYAVRFVTLAGTALPNFWIALMLILALLVWFSWTPPIFYVKIWNDPWMHMQKMIWPALILAWGYSSYLTRVTRSTMLEVLRQDYVRTARSRGLVERIVVAGHALPNALIPVVTLGGLQLATLFSGTVVIEQVFSLPGVGQGIAQAAFERDYPVIQSLVMLLVTLMLTLNVVIDVIYAKLDPRISYAR